VRELSRLSKLGTPGKLGSFAKLALEVDRLAEEFTELGRAALAAAAAKLENADTAFDGALALAEVRRKYVTLPTLNEEILAELNRVRADEQLRGMLKLAEQLDEARELLETPANQARGIRSLERIAAQNPDTQAAAVAKHWLQDHSAAEGPEASAADPTAEMHSWSSHDGFTVQAALIGYGYAEDTNAPFVRLRTREGKRVEVPFARLSSESQTLAKQLVQRLRETSADE
jgi:hypothetical protein